MDTDTKNAVQTQVVPVWDYQQPVRGYDRNGDVTALGMLVQRDYERTGRDHGVARRSFLVSQSGDQYALGLCSQHTRIIDPYTLARPLVEVYGLKPVIASYARGGAKTFLVLSLQQPEYAVDIAGETSYPAVGIWHQMHVGHGTLCLMGYFRTLCTNGLIAQMLRLGSLRLTKSADDLPQLISSWYQESVAKLQKNGSGIWSPYPHMKGISRLITLLEREDLDSIPPVLRDLLRPLLYARSSMHFRERLLEELASLHRTSTTLDIVNAVTNTGRIWEVEKRPAWWYWSTEPLFRAIDQMAQLLAWLD